MSHRIRLTNISAIDPEHREKPLKPHLAGYYEGEAEGAFPNGTRIEKCNTDTSDALLNGAQGTVLSSLKIPEGDENGISIGPDEFLYFIEWDKFPGVPCGIHSRRVRRIEDE